jgi:hypothetical protein
MRLYIKKKPKARRSGGVAGVVEQLHRKYMALNSNTTTTNKEQTHI